MIKKKKKRPIYNIGQKKFNTFKAMKSFVWYNSHTDEEIQGFELGLKEKPLKEKPIDSDSLSVLDS